MLEGHFFDGNRSKKIHCYLSINDDGMVYFEGFDHPPISWNSIKVSSRIAQTPRLLILPNGACFETHENNLVDQYATKFGQQKLLNPYDWETKLSYIAASILLTAAMVFFLFYSVTPNLSEYIAKKLPVEFSKGLSDSVLEQLDSSYFSSSEIDPHQQEKLIEIFNQYLPDQEYNYRLIFRGGENVTANAFALPDGTVILTDQLIQILNDDEVLSIMLHEIGHIKHRHTLRLTIQSTSLWTLYGLLTGDASATSQLIVAFPAVLMQMHFNRNLEYEADTYSLEKMIENSINPIIFAQAMEKIEHHYFQNNNSSKTSLNKPLDSEESRENDYLNAMIPYLSTHPTSEERIKRFKKSANDFTRSSQGQ